MPDQVFFMYMNNIFIKQLEIMIEKVSVTMTKLSCKYLTKNSHSQ